MTVRLKKRAFILVCLSFLAYNALHSQNFSGKIVNEKQETVFGGYVFVKETNQGLPCNENGEFWATLPQGAYTVEYRCLGYETQQEKISIGNAPVYRTAILAEKTFELQEVTVSAKEDPAYEIMRKAIEKAPFHLNHVKNYKAEAYIKGSMEITGVSKLADKLSSSEGMKLSDFKDNLFLQESFSEITFVAPDKYAQTVKAFSSSIPDNLNPKDAMGLMRGSIYASQISGKVSPLNAKSFSYYKFRYLGFSDENGQTVYKIEIVPKLNDPILLRGYLYIAENSWDVRHAELTGRIYGLIENCIITYGEVMPEVFLPITYSNRIDGSLLGVNGFFNYYASVKYLNIDLNPADSTESILNRKAKKNLNITDERKRQVESDSLATKRDSTFWAAVRNIPLLDSELKSYQIKDSIQQRVDSLHKAYHHGKFKPADILFGGQLGG
ncbi:MAG: DUF5686 and carboxypeptidase regulatory-like domain-containing protein, partial [Prevotella sp.]|nr:DUF5686 and carboxypeptidase regulatory-like domain-containing protein [Prevotella sp.]